jgi:hypothetical protein
MSFEHSPTKQTKDHRRAHTGAALPFLADDNQVLTFKEWCALNRISARNGRRLLQKGEGPVVTRLSPRRIGITRRNNRIWQEDRGR